MYTKLFLSGHVRNAPERKQISYISNPQGISNETLIKSYGDFLRAFTLEECKLS